MAIPHVFANYAFPNGYQSANGILSVNLNYKPTVMIVGTYNPDPNVDIWYGRNHFWPAFANLSSNGYNANNALLSSKRIFKLCKDFGFTFSDLISSVLFNNNPLYTRTGNIVTFNGKEYNLIKDEHLASLARLNQVDWNTPNIINYLKANKQIDSIYFTRQPTGIWHQQWNNIVTNPSLAGRLKTKTNIYTPSAQGGALHQQTGIYNQGKMIPLLNHWVHNVNPGFGRLDNNWLIAKGINPNNF